MDRHYWPHRSKAGAEAEGGEGGKKEERKRGTQENSKDVGKEEDRAHMGRLGRLPRGQESPH